MSLRKSESVQKLDSGRAPQSIHSETDASATSLRAWLNLSLNPPRCVQDCSCEDVMRRHLVETMTAHQRDICGPIEKISQRIMAGRISCCMSSQSILNAGAAVEALLSYDAQWLRVALELLAVGSPRTMSLQISKQGLMRHLFTDPQNALATLKAVPRLLHVIALIDRSAMHPPLGTPLLFACRDGNAPGRNSHISSRLHHHPRSTIKSSAAMLQAVVGPLLGEADCGRYLSRFGYKVSFVQTPLNEALDASMAISNLAVDFRDGVRLCRLSQRLTGRYLLQQVRFPAIKRPDRLFNVELALNSLACAYPLPKFSKSASKGTSRALGIVDGDKSTTMGLLWHLVMANHLPRLLTPVSLWAATNCGAREQSAFARQVVETYLNTIDTVPGGLMHTIFKLHGQFLCPLLQWIESFLKEEEKICGSGRTLTGLLEDGTLVCRIVGERCWPERGQHRNYEAALTALLKQQNTSKGDSGGSGSSSESPFWWSVIGCPPARSGRVSISSHKSKADTEACAIMFVSALCFEMLEKKKEHYAATIIQRRWRAVCDPRVPAAVAIQAAWRGFRARRAYFDHHVVPRIAAACLVRRKHMVEAVNAFKTLRRKQEVETTRDRLKVLAQTMAEFAVKSAAATKIQRAAREYLQRKKEKEKNKDENKAYENVDARPCPMKNQMPKETKRRPALRELTNCTKHTVLL